MLSLNASLAESRTMMSSPSESEESEESEDDEDEEEEEEEAEGLSAEAADEVLERRMRRALARARWSRLRGIRCCRRWAEPG